MYMPNNQLHDLVTIYQSILQQNEALERTMVTFSWMTDVDTDCWSVPALSSLDVCPSSAIVLHVMNE